VGLEAGSHTIERQVKKGILLSCSTFLGDQHRMKMGKGKAIQFKAESIRLLQ
jgi:hypothetical protein